MGLDRIPDNMMVAAAQRGDRGAFSELVLRHQKRVYNLALRVLRDPDDAADVSQETFVLALQRLPQLRSAESFGSWLGQITMNVCRSWMRSPSRTRELLLNDTNIEGWSDPSSDDPSRRDEIQRTRRAVAKLPHKYREAVIAYYFAGKSHQEAARLAGVPVRTFKTRLCRARECLRRSLAALSDPEERS